MQTAGISVLWNKVCGGRIETMTADMAKEAQSHIIADLKNIIDKEVSVRNWLMKM
jgi:hypothetical protein